MAVNLCPVLNWQQSDANSVILANGTIETYLAGSSTPATTYSDPNGTTPQANPIVLNVRGEPANLIYLTAGLLYKFIRKDGSGNVIGQPLDYIRGINDVTATSDQFIAFGGVATYISATSFSLIGDQTSTFHVGRALKLLTSGGTVYAKILSSAYTTLTTITIQQATGALDAGITGTSPSYGIITNNDNSLPASIDYRVQNQSANYALATGTATAVTASPSPAYGAVAAGQAINLTMPNAATGVAMTLQLTGQAALTALNQDGTNPVYPAGFKATWELNTAATQWVLKNPISLPNKLLSITCTQSAGALTFGIPASSLDFRSTTLTNGAPVTINNAALSLVLPSGGTLGFITTVLGRAVLVAINNAGTTELAVISQPSGNTLDETNLINTTAIGAGSTSANVFYSTTARTGVAYRVVGYIEAINTAGAWASPSLVQGAGGNAVVVMGNKKFTSTGQTITSGGLLTLAHGLGYAPEDIKLRLKCTTTEAGWAVGDEVFISNGGDYNNSRHLGIYVDSVNVYIRLGNAASVFVIANKTTGATIGLTNSSWNLLVIAK